MGTPIIAADRDYVDRQIENVRNEVKRHSRIRLSSVRMKPGRGPVYSPVNFPNVLSFPHPGLFQQVRQREGKCSCPPGTVCGNAACPYMPIVIC